MNINFKLQILKIWNNVASKLIVEESPLKF